MFLVVIFSFCFGFLVGLLSTSYSFLKKFFEKVQEKYNIKQLTVWTITDSTNFLLDKKNKSLIEQGKKPLESIYAGAFRQNGQLTQQSQNEVKQEQPKVENKQSTKQQTSIFKKQKSFAQRSASEMRVHQQIKQKNQMIKQQKAQKKQANKPKVRTLTASNFQNSSKGYVNIVVLSLVVSFVAGALFMIVYMIIRR